jgi:hypothetical protein
MIKRVTFAAIVICLIATSSLVQSQLGGVGQYTAYKLKKTVKKKARHIFKALSQFAHEEWDQIKNLKKSLVHYSQQVVNGLNHAFVFRLLGKDKNQKKFTCLKVYETLDKKFSISAIGSGNTKEEAAQMCKIPSNFESKADL